MVNEKPDFGAQDRSQIDRTVVADARSLDPKATAPELLDFTPHRGVELRGVYKVKLRCVYCTVPRNEDTNISDPRRAQHEAIQRQGMVVTKDGVACQRCAQRAADE